MKCRLQIYFLGLFLAISSHAATHYVNINNASPSSPYTSWATAARNIQDAIDASSDGNIVLVTNGVYETGGRAVYGSMTNRVVIDKEITVKNVNGPGATIIKSASAPDGGNGVIGITH